LGKNSNPTKGNLGHFGKSHNLPADWARELFKPSRLRKSCTSELKTFVLDVVFVDVYLMGLCLCIFCLHQDDIRPWTSKPRAIFDSSFYWL